MATFINMPKLSPTMEEGVLAKWTKKVGDKIAPGDVIAEVETDKANMDFPLEDEGVILKLLVNEGDTVKLGAPVAILGEAGEDASAVPVAVAPAVTAKIDKPAAAAKAPPASAPAPVAAPRADAPLAAPAVTFVNAPANLNAPAPTNGRVKASPLARKLAREHGVDLHSLAGSGPFGRVVQRDILDAARNGAVAPAAPVALRAFVPSEIGVDSTSAPSQMRKTIARRLTESSRDVPHIYLTAEATVDRLLELREQTNVALGIKISVNDLVVKALAVALRRIPQANVSWVEGAEGPSIVRHGRVDIGVAVSLPDGLITPVVRNADQKGLGHLSAEVRELAGRAKEKKLKPEEYTGATASVSNLGMYGVREFTAIINPPEAVILAVGTTEKRSVVIEKDGVDVVAVARRMTLTLSCDHRIVDGVLGAQLLQEIVRNLENPLALAV